MRLTRAVTGSQNYKDRSRYGNPGAPYGNFNYGATAAARGFSLDVILLASDAFDRLENLWERGDPFSGDDIRDITDVTSGYFYFFYDCYKK